MHACRVYYIECTCCSCNEISPVHCHRGRARARAVALIAASTWLFSLGGFFFFARVTPRASRPLYSLLRFVVWWCGRAWKFGSGGFLWLRFLYLLLNYSSNDIDCLGWIIVSLVSFFLCLTSVCFIWSWIWNTNVFENCTMRDCRSLKFRKIVFRNCV